MISAVTAMVSTVLASRVMLSAQLFEMQHYADAGLRTAVLLIGALGVMVFCLTCPSKIKPMQLTTGIVVGGKIIVEGDPLPEGTVVTILARDNEETFDVPAELIERLNRMI